MPACLPPALPGLHANLPVPPLQGVQLTHENVMAAIISLQIFVTQTGMGLDDTDVFLSFLPLAHIFDRSFHGCTPPPAALSPAAARPPGPAPPCPARRPAPAAAAACRASS